VPRRRLLPGCTALLGATWLILALPQPPVVAQPAAASEARWEFDKDEDWRVWYDKKKPRPPFEASDRDGDWAVTILPSDEKVSLQTYAVKIANRQRLHDLRAFTLRAELETGDQAEVLATFKDEAGNRFTLETRPLTPGPNEVTWELPRDFVKNPPAPVGGLTLFNLRVQRSIEHADRPVRVRLEDATPVMFEPVGDAVSVDLQTGDPLHLVKPGAAHGPWLDITNHTDGDLSLHVRLDVTDRYDATPRWGAPRAIRVKAGQVQTLRYDASAAATPGIGYAHWRIELPDGRHLTDLASFAVMNPVGKTPGVEPEDFVFGTAGFHREWSSPQERVELLSHAASIAGVESNRFGTEWRSTERRQGEYNWRYLDRFVDVTLADGMEPQLLVSFGGAPWTKSPQMLARIEADGEMSRQWRYPPRIDLWEGFVRAVAERYRGRVRLYEIWNEPDISYFLGTTEEYLEVIEAAHRVIKSVDPDAIVISGGMASIEHRHAKLDLFDRLFTDHADTYDWFGYHRHGPFHHFERDLQKVFDRRANVGGVVKPLYFNETGLFTDRASEHEMATALVKKLTHAWSLGAKGYHWFCLWVPDRDSQSSAYGFRMFNEDFTPRPIYPAYNNLARYLRGRTYSHALDLGEGRYGYAFRGDGVFTGDGDRDYVLVVWTEDAALAPAVLTLEVGQGGTAKRVGLMGAEQPLNVHGGTTLLHIGHEPSLIVLDDVAGKPTDPQPLVQPAPGLTLVGRRPGEASITVRNPMPEAMSVELAWSVTGDLLLDDASAEPIRTKINPGSSQTFTAQTRLNPTRDRLGGIVGSVEAAWKLDGLDAREVSSIPVREARAIADADAASSTAREPDFRLDRADQVVNHSDVDPDTFAYRWLGPDDLSASVWLARDGRFLSVIVEVTDDEHRQRHEPRNMWQADSLQLGIALPDREAFWELGVALDERGGVQTHTWGVPAGIDPAASPWRRTGVVRSASTTTYRLELDVHALAGGVAPDRLDFNVLVNDSDDSFREGFIQLAPGIAENKDAMLFVPLRFSVSSDRTTP
jgi:hypothetical protein